MMEQFYGGALLVFGLLVAAAFGYNKWLEYQGADLDHKLDMIAEVVQAAEQMLGKEPGATRLEWVLEQIQARFPDLNVDDARLFVEAAVFRMKQSAPRVIKIEDQSINDHGGSYWLGTGRHN